MQGNLWNVLKTKTSTHGKLWSFGCSNAAGGELGSGQTENQIKQWFIQNTGYDNWFDGIGSNKLSIIEYEKIYMKWFRANGSPTDATLSYAGQLAILTNKQLVSHAICGCGIDRSFNEFLSAVQYINWDNDIVLFECTPFDRYMIDDSVKLSNLQVSITDDIAAMKYIPSASTIEYLYIGILHYIKTNFPKVHCISIQNFVKSKQQVYEYSTSFVHDYFTNNNVYLNDISMFDFALEKIGKYSRMPGSHYTETVQTAFAEYLLDLLD